MTFHLMSLRSPIARLVLATALLGAFTPAQADDGLGVGAGLEYSSGKYGTAQSTNILYVPLTLSYFSGRAAFSLTLPYISITGPGGVIQGYGQIGASGSPMGGGGMRYGRPAGSSAQTTTTNSGLGDVIASAGYRLHASEAMSLDVAGKVKFGTANADKGLGTGKNDYAAQLDGRFLIGDADTLFVTAGYKVVGKPEGVTANNVAYGTLGIDHLLNDEMRMGATYNAAQSAFATSAALRDVTLYVSRQGSDDMALQAALLKGLADGSPDYGGQLSISGRF